MTVEQNISSDGGGFSGDEELTQLGLWGVGVCTGRRNPRVVSEQVHAGLLPRMDQGLKFPNRIK